MKVFYSELNPVPDILLVQVAKNAEYFLFQPTWKLTKANSEVLKSFLTFDHPKAKRMQQNLFDYILYHFLTEQFSEDHYQEYIDNVG